MQTRRKYEADPVMCTTIDFTKETRIEYLKDIFVRDLSTDEQVKLGLNVFHVKVQKTTCSPLHNHKVRYQMIYVREGSIYDKISKTTFKAGDLCYISKETEHAIKYIKGAEIVFIYIPGLNPTK